MTLAYSGGASNLHSHLEVKQFSKIKEDKKDDNMHTQLSLSVIKVDKFDCGSGL